MDSYIECLLFKVGLCYLPMSCLRIGCSKLLLLTQAMYARPQSTKMTVVSMRASDPLPDATVLVTVCCVSTNVVTTAGPGVIVGSSRAEKGDAEVLLAIEEVMQTEAKGEAKKLLAIKGTDEMVGVDEVVEAMIEVERE